MQAELRRTSEREMLTQRLTRCTGFLLNALGMPQALGMMPESAEIVEGPPG